MASARIATRLVANTLLCASATALLALLPTNPAAAAAEGRAASACANTTLTPRTGNLEVIREAILCLVNREREAHGESALVENAKLTRAAQGHSEDMAAADYFSHYAPSGSSPLDRMRASGYLYSSQLGYEIGENIAWGTLWLASPQSIVSAWMASPEHRANILDAGYRETGVGVSPHAPASLAEGQAGGLYTQDFGTIFSDGQAARHAAAHHHTSSGGHPRNGHLRTLSSEQPRSRHSQNHHPGSRRSKHLVRRHDARRHNSAKRGSDRSSFRRLRHLGRSTVRPRRITSGARTTERSHKDHGSTRRQVRHRHRVRARHRSRHRRAAHRARRAGTHQRSRR